MTKHPWNKIKGLVHLEYPTGSYYNNARKKTNSKFYQTHIAKYVSFLFPGCCWGIEWSITPAPQCWALPFFPFSPRPLLPQQRRKRPLLRAILGLKGSKSIGWMAINGASSISFMAAGVQCLWKMVGFHGKIMDVFHQNEDFGVLSLFSETATLVYRDGHDGDA